MGLERVKMKDLVDTKHLKVVTVKPVSFVIKQFFRKNVAHFRAEHSFLTLESIYRYSKKYDAIVSTLDENSLKLVQKSLSIDISFIFVVNKNDRELLKEFIGFKRVSFLFIPFDEMQGLCMLYGLAKATLLKDQLSFLEKNLRESQHISKLGSWEYDVEKDSFWLSNEVYEILPITKNMQLKDPVSMLGFLPKKQKLYITHTLKNAIDKKENFSIEFSFEIEQKEHFFRAAGEVIKHNNKIKRVIGTFQNIDESKKIEGVLKKQKAVASEIVDSQANMIILTDGEKLLGANQSFFDFFNCHNIEDFPKKYGSFQTQFIKKENFLESSSSQWLDEVIANRNKKEESKVSLQNSVTSEVRDFLVRISKFTGDGDYVVTFSDITEHIKSEEILENEISQKTWDLIEINNKLIEQTEMFDEAESLAKVGSWYFDLKTDMFYWSKQMYCIYEGEKNEENLTYDEILNTVDIKEKDFFKELFQNAIDSKRRDLRVEHKITFNNEKEKVLVTNLVVERDREIPFKVFGYTQDVTEQREFEKKQRESEKLLIQQTKMAELGSMTGAIAHQWKQPLNSLAIMLQELLDAYEFDDLDEEHLRATVDKGMNNIQFMSQTIDDFRNFFKPSKKKTDFCPKEAIESVISILSAQLLKNSIKINFITDVENLHIFGFENEFKQVILNLVNNSKEAFTDSLEGNNAIDISLRVKEESVVVTVEDNAGGIPTEVIEKIFEEYFTTKGDDGTGIGLYMCRNIITNNMEGEISVENSSLGARFTIKLPRA